MMHTAVAEWAGAGITDRIDVYKRQVLEAGGTIRAINAKGLADKLSRKNIDKLGEVAKTYGAKGLAYSCLLYTSRCV